jgi:DNA-binding transcriptional LysR family regulator
VRALAEAGTDLSALRVAGEMGSAQAVKQAVRAGVGVSLVSRLAVEDECRARLLVCVQVRDLHVRRSFHVVTHRDRSRSPLAQAFLEFVESQTRDRASQEP